MSAFNLHVWLDDYDLHGMGLTPNCPEDDVRQVTKELWGDLADEYDPPPVTYELIEAAVRERRDYQKWKIEFTKRVGESFDQVLEQIVKAKPRVIEQEGDESYDFDELEDAVNGAIRLLRDWFRK